jgi:hypothetical protein
MHDKHLPNRPTLGSEGVEAQEAIHAVEHLVEELQAGAMRTSRTDILRAISGGAARSGQPFVVTTNSRPSTRA